jgi:hypothetical protein
MIKDLFYGVLTGIYISVVWIILVMNLALHLNLPKQVEPRLQPLCIKGSELKAINRYHGKYTPLKIEGSKVSIWRDKRWIRIKF